MKARIDGIDCVIQSRDNGGRQITDQHFMVEVAEANMSLELYLAKKVVLTISKEMDFSLDCRVSSISTNHGNRSYYFHLYGIEPAPEQPAPLDFGPLEPASRPAYSQSVVSAKELEPKKQDKTGPGYGVGFD